MRNIRRLGEVSLDEAEAALRTVKTNTEEAASVHAYMQAYKLLADYYERKVLAATAALIYGFGGKPQDKLEAERLADEAVELYATAIEFISKRIDKGQGQIRGRWGGKDYTLDELIQRERDERRQLPILFNWPREEPEGEAEAAAAR